MSKYARNLRFSTKNELFLKKQQGLDLLTRIMNQINNDLIDKIKNFIRFKISNKVIILVL